MPSPRKRTASPSAPPAPNAEVLTTLGRIEVLLTRIADRLDPVSSPGGLSSNPPDASRQLEPARLHSDQPGLGAQDAAAAVAKAVANAVARSVAPASVQRPARLPTAQRAR